LLEDLRMIDRDARRRRRWIGLTLFIAIAGTAYAATRPDLKYDEVVLAEGCDLTTTAVDSQQDLIRRLLQSGRDAVPPAEVTIDYPLDASIFPPEIIPPTFLWHDADAAADRWLVDIVFAAGPARVHVLVPGPPPPQGEIDPIAVSSTNEVYQPTPYQASARSWKPSRAVWQTIKKHSTGKAATLTFFGYRSDDPTRVVSRGRMTLSTSTDPLGAPIFYRDVPLMPPPEKKNRIMPLPKGALPLIKWRLRDISKGESRVMFGDMPTCANCHSFSADGKTLGMDIDGPSGDKGAYAISPISKKMVIESEEVISWNTYKGKTSKTLGFLSRMSPDGKYAVTTLNEQIYVANFADFKFGQVFYPTRGILAYYDTESKEIDALPGADDTEYVHVDPVWTPDGKEIVFARGKARDAFLEGVPLATYAGDPNETPMQYDLMRMPFNGGRGGEPRPIAGASSNGMSNSFPKVSPDGKWIVFVKCKNGQLMRPDSKLWIVPAMFLTHIDEQGHDSPAVLIENSTAANRAVNIPEFVNRPYDEFESIYVAAVEHYRHYDEGQALAREGRVMEAIAEYEKALEENTKESRVLVQLSKALIAVGQTERALGYTKAALEINPFNYEMHTNMGFLLAGKGETGLALDHLGAATRINPVHPMPWYNRATLYLQLGDYSKAVADYSEAIRLVPRFPDALI
jgi:tetratricopeptide (TPR) repeat protein